MWLSVFVCVLELGFFKRWQADDNLLVSSPDFVTGSSVDIVHGKAIRMQQLELLTK